MIKIKSLKEDMNEVIDSLISEFENVDEIGRVDLPETERIAKRANPKVQAIYGEISRRRIKGIYPMYVYMVFSSPDLKTANIRYKYELVGRELVSKGSDFVDKER